MKKRKEIVLGITFIIAIAILFLGIDFLKGHHLFSRNDTYYVRYSNVTGLSKTSPIFTNGVHIGSVDDILYNFEKPEEIIVKINVDHRMAIPRGSLAILETELLGSVSMNLLLATNTQDYYSVGDTLDGILNKGATTELASIIPQMNRLINNINSLVISTQKIVTDSSTFQIIHNTEDLTAEAKQKMKEFSNIIDDVSELVNIYKGLGNDLSCIADSLKSISTTKQLEQITTNLETTLADLSYISAKIDSKDGTVGMLINDKSLYTNIESLCSQMQSLIQDVKDNPERYIRIFGRKNK